MAGWICQTRKIISAVMSSLADDLEQTVQEMNDVIYRLGSTHEDRSSSQPQTLPDNIPHNEKPHSEQNRPQNQPQLNPTVEEPRPHGQHQAFVFRGQPKATQITQPEATQITQPEATQITQPEATQITQPEASGFPSALNSRLSQSAPTLQISEDTIPVSEDKYVGTWQPVSKSSLHSLISSSSPCLMYTPVTPAEPSDIPSLVMSEHRLRNSHLHSKSVRQTMTSASQNVCPCHRQDSLKITRVMKHPGRVIRTQSSITQEQGQPPTREDPTQSPVMEDHNYSFNQSSCTQIPGGQHDDIADYPRCVSDLKDGQPGSQQSGEESNLALVEHDTHFLRWASLRPFTRMLSFAFAQLANAVLIFSENSRSAHSLTSSPSALGTEPKHHEVTSAVYPVGMREHGQMETTSRGHGHGQEQEGQHLSVLQRTYSTDSFEILESPCSDGAAEGGQSIPRMVSEFQAHQTHPRPVCDALNHRIRTSSSHVSSACPHDYDDDGLTGMSTSSTDFVCFDFRKLLIDDHFRVEKPVWYYSSQGSPDANSCSIEGDFLVVGGDCPNQSFSGDRSSSGQSAGHHHDTDDDDDDDDDDGDSSGSFIILSGNDINNAELIF